ncbi:hypothetical protein BOTBODRAFT_40008 [Botryobasidium botryosum FD-172 SS1]|uniref:Uncharacterized protein n=1 Tax=Botryobasidium botryosum (strain FD-172 SS1) TaxID=930990 RepID=A0A067LTL6_BOTB1|nr:hypothetical protein BOTBODRAFT_40008 [Botryobasidium botryosum FD-172 SS1]
MERSSSPEQDVTLPAAAFTDYLANTLKLSQQSTADLHVFCQVSSGMPEEQLRAAVFLCAMSFRTQQLIEQQNKNFESLTEVLEQVKRAMTHNVAFTDIQKVCTHSPEGTSSDVLSG